MEQNGAPQDVESALLRGTPDEGVLREGLKLSRLHCENAGARLSGAFGLGFAGLGVLDDEIDDRARHIFAACLFNPFKAG